LIEELGQTELSGRRVFDTQDLLEDWEYLLDLGGDRLHINRDAKLRKIRLAARGDVGHEGADSVV